MTSDLFNNDIDSYKSKPKCHMTHKPLQIGMGEILGAACGSPRKGYDIYIGFDYGMKFTNQKYPWDMKSYDDPTVEFQYNITDMKAPKSPKDFKKMVEWVSEQLDDGKKVHVGCIGGHGRTGTFLAALVSLYEDLTDDPIKWVRENHCKKAVESKVQVKFLVKHFGCKTAAVTKSFSSSSSDWGTQTGRFSSAHPNFENAPKGDNVTSLPRRNNSPEKIRCMTGKGSIWG